MKISIKQFLSPIHSWGTVGTSIARFLIKNGHEVHLCSTNSYKNFPKDLESSVKCRECNIDEKRKNPCKLDHDYDLSLSYTMMLHFGDYLSHSKKNKFGIWNYDGTEIPKGFVKNYKFCTKVLPSSVFSKNVFLKAGVPESIMEVIPHGYNEEFINRDVVYKINTDRKRKVLVNIQQNHLRKNISGIFEAWGKAFTNKDDVIMFAKIKTSKERSVDISWSDELIKMKKKYSNHAPVIIISNFIDYMSDLYRACDVVFSASNIECFLLPALEGFASNKIVIASNWGGNIDFMNNENSLLINGKVARAPAEMQYWGGSLYGECFYPSTDHAAELLQKSIYDYDNLISKFSPSMETIRKEYTWANVVNKIQNLCDG